MAMAAAAVVVGTPAALTRQVVRGIEVVVGMGGGSRNAGKGGGRGGSGDHDHGGFGNHGFMVVLVITVGQAITTKT